MSNCKQCDRCKKLVKQNYGIGEIVRRIGIKLGKNSPHYYDICADCIDGFAKYMGFKKTNE